MIEDEKITCGEDDAIDVLGLSVRVYNALRRSRVHTIGELLEVHNADKLFAIRNMGEKGVAQIEGKLANITLISSPQRHEKAGFSAASNIPIIDLTPRVPIQEVVKWQQALLAKQMRAGLLHPEIAVDGKTLGELAQASIFTADLYDRLLKILASLISVSDELEFLLSLLRPRELDILRRRYGFRKQTLETVGIALSITRERVRQLEKQGISRFESTIASVPLIRIRSAILFAGDSGMDISFEDWSQRLLRTGLLGDWTNEKFFGFDQIELMVAVCKLTSDSDTAIEFPKCLDYILRLHGQGKSSTPARVLYLTEKVSSEERKLVRRHLQHSGAVSLEWLVEQEDMRYAQTEMQEILEAHDFFEVGNGWYMSYDYMPDSLGKSHVFHKSLFKMFQYCGPLEIRDVYFGIEHTLVKTEFPVPPPDALKTILKKYGYSSEDDLWYWDGEISEELNTGEAIILETIRKTNGVAHHFELAHAMIDSALSFASLHATLQRSPLFDNFQRSLYKLRGLQPSYDAIERARLAKERTPVNLHEEYDTHGNIIIGANLGILAIGSGTLMSDKLPNLEGEWEYKSDNGKTRKITVTENEIRGLSTAIRYFDCKVGDRIQLIFNAWDRTVAINKEFK